MDGKIPYKLGQIMLEMQGALFAAVPHEGSKVMNVEAVQRWLYQITEIVKKYDLDDLKPD